MEYLNHVTLITGANGGLGSEIAKHLLTLGYKNIACHYRGSPERAASVLTEFGLEHSKHLFQADLTDETQVQAMHKAISESLGPVTNIINLAGGSTNGMSWKISSSDYQEVIDMNLKSTFLVCKEFIPELRGSRLGRIVNISSVVAFKGVVGASHYCAAKAGIAGYSVAIAQELASSNITVNVIALGYFDTGLITHVPEDIQKTIIDSIPLKRFGTTEEITGLLNYLLSPAGAYMTGQVLHLNGGLYS